MRTTFMLFLILSIYSVKTFGQVNDFSFEGSKTYPNGQKIAYFYLNGLKDQHQAYFLKKNITDNNDIDRFSILKYTSSNTYCMVECKEQIDKIALKKLINQNIEEYNTKFSESTNLREFYLDLYSINNMPEYIDTGNRREDVINFKEKFETWKNNNPEEYKKIQSISIDIFIQ